MEKIVTLNTPFGEVTVAVKFFDETGTTGDGTESFLHPVITDIDPYFDLDDEDEEVKTAITDWLKNNKEKILETL